MTGPCKDGAYCYPIFSNGTKQVPGKIIAGQPGPPQTVGNGNIVGFVCSTTPQGKPGEKFWANACPGTWGPNGPFYPTKSGGGTQPKKGSCVPPNPPPPPPGYKLVWKKASIAGVDGKFTNFVCKPVYIPEKFNPKSDKGCEGCANKASKSGGPTTPTPPAQGGQIPPTSPTTGPQDGCGPTMSDGGSASKYLFGHDAGEHFEKGAVTGQLIPLPVHDSADATAQPDWTQRPRVIYGPNGIAQIWDGSADGLTWLAPAELYDYHLLGDGTLHDALWPGQISQHGLGILSGARGTGAHGDRPNGILAFGLAHKTKRTPVTGWYALLDSGTLAWRPTDSDADDDTNERRMIVDGVLEARADAKVPAASNPNTGDYAATTLWANSGDSNYPYWGSDKLAKYSDISGGGDVTAASNITDNAAVRGDGGAKGVQDSAVIISDVSGNNVSISPTSGNSITLRGYNNAGGNGTATYVRGGSSTGSSSVGGTLYLYGGDASGNSSTSGNIVMDADAASGSGASNGTISIGTTNASALTIGRSGVTTTINGTLALGGELHHSNAGYAQSNFPENQADFDGATVIEWSSVLSTGGTINGIKAGATGRVIYVYNTDPTYSLTIAHNSGSAAAADQVIFASAGNLVVAPGEISGPILYVDSKWRSAQ
jgi:hypothetical protein